MIRQKSKKIFQNNKSKYLSNTVCNNLLKIISILVTAYLTSELHLADKITVTVEDVKNRQKMPIVRPVSVKLKNLSLNEIAVIQKEVL